MLTLRPVQDMPAMGVATAWMLSFRWNEMMGVWRRPQEKGACLLQAVSGVLYRDAELVLVVGVGVARGLVDERGLRQDGVPPRVCPVHQPVAQEGVLERVPRPAAHLSHSATVPCAAFSGYKDST